MVMLPSHAMHAKETSVDPCLYDVGMDKLSVMQNLPDHIFTNCSPSPFQKFDSNLNHTRSEWPSRSLVELSFCNQQDLTHSSQEQQQSPHQGAIVIFR